MFLGALISNTAIQRMDGGYLRLNTNKHNRDVMNNLQKIACLISGYNPDQPSPSEIVDGYYLQPTMLKRVKYIMIISRNYEEIQPVNERGAINIDNFIQLSNKEDRCKSFQALGVDFKDNTSYEVATRAYSENSEYILNPNYANYVKALEEGFDGD